MRKLLFALVLVAASFSGGAVINGPGFRWARDLLLNEPGAGYARYVNASPCPDPQPYLAQGAARASLVRLTAGEKPTVR